MPGRNHERSLTVAITVMLMAMAMTAAAASDEPKFPDWSGQWVRTYGGNPRYDQTKPIRKQEAPLKPEYQARFEASIADQNAGGHGLDRGYTCLPQGMPRMMSGVSMFEFVFAPSLTYVLFERTEFAPRRIYTDGRGWPTNEEPSFNGYSIGKWIDDGHGGFDALEVETRMLKGPRTFEASGIPMHPDNETVVKERLYLDKSDKNVMHNEITTYDHALTQPWTVNKRYLRVQDKDVIFYENECSENNQHVIIGHEGYYLSADGYLMPVKKGQKPPDLRYFKETQK